MNICVFCASSSEIKDSYKETARSIGRFIAKNNHTLVYGGATGGLMTEIAEATHKNNGKIIGVIPESIINKGRLSALPDQLIRVKSMSERKEVMSRLADIFITLPGGIGTLDEFFDVSATSLVGDHNKPIILVNDNDYYKGLLLQLQRMTDEKLGSTKSIHQFTVVCSDKECFQIIDELTNQFLN